MGVLLNASVLYDRTPVDNHDQREPIDLDAAEDAVLAALSRKGDFQAFEVLVRRYRNEVFALAYHFVRNREEAWDISQEVFIKAHRAVGRFRKEGAFKHWLMRITANQCKDFLKKRRLSTVPFEDTWAAANAPSGNPGPDGSLAARELGEAIVEALNALPDKHRTAFVLREFEGLSYDDMARVMGCSMGTVMSRLHHARKKLSKKLVQSGALEGSRYV